MAELKLFDLFHKKKFVDQKGLDSKKIQHEKLLKTLIEKAISFIKVKQFQSGFTEVSYPEQGGDIDVTIEQEGNNPDLFRINFTFMSIPERVPILREQKVVPYSEIKRLAQEYDNNKLQIDDELKNREQLVSYQSTH
jgi:hypothetical protein